MAWEGRFGEVWVFLRESESEARSRLTADVLVCFVRGVFCGAVQMRNVCESFRSRVAASDRTPHLLGLGLRLV